MKSFLEEFKKFAFRGNVFDMAVGVIIGAAFKAIVDSLVTDVISPILGIFANSNFSDLEVAIGGATLKYGAFISAVLNFLLTAFALFLIVRAINRLHPQQPAEEPKKPRLCPYCKGEIADDATRCPHCTSRLDSENN